MGESKEVQEKTMNEDEYMEVVNELSARFDALVEDMITILTKGLSKFAK